MERTVSPKEEPIFLRWHILRSNKSGMLAALLAGVSFALIASATDSAKISHCAVKESTFFHGRSG